MQNEQRHINSEEESNSRIDVSDHEYRIISARIPVHSFSSRDWPGRFQSAEALDCSQVFRSDTTQCAPQSENMVNDTTITQTDADPKRKSDSEQKIETQPANNPHDDYTMEDDIPEPLPVSGTYHPMNPEEVMEALGGDDTGGVMNVNSAEDINSAKDSNIDAQAPQSESEESLDTEFITKGRVPRRRVPKRDVDVLLGRGETANTHPGNNLFREERDKFKQTYREVERSKRKQIAVRLARRVHKWGGAFMRKDRGKKETWSEVSDSEAIEKCSHALREKKEVVKKRKPVSNTAILDDDRDKKRPPMN